VLKRIAVITSRSPIVIGAICEPGSSDLLTFERRGGVWEPAYRVQTDGPTFPLPACFKPRSELLSALDEALVAPTGRVEFEMEV
jgi:hypothetical protein